MTIDAAAALLHEAGISVSGYGAAELDDALALGVAERPELVDHELPKRRRKPRVILLPEVADLGDVPDFRPSEREALVRRVGWPRAA